MVARLYEEIGTIAISRKEKLPNNISTIDSETWSQLINILRELMEKCENTLDCHDFAIKAQIGESAYRTWKKELNVIPDYAKSYPDSEFVVNLFPRFIQCKWWRQYRPINKKAIDLLAPWKMKE